MINGINHINIAVSDIERSFLFYKDILGFKPLCKSEGSAYFLAGNPDDPRCLWFSLDLDRSSLRRPSPCNTHFAFSVNDGDFEALCQRITQSGAKVFKDNTSPGKSLYFLDPDDRLRFMWGTGRPESRLKKPTLVTGKMWSGSYDQNRSFEKASQYYTRTCTHLA